MSMHHLHAVDYLAYAHLQRAGGHRHRQGWEGYDAEGVRRFFFPHQSALDAAGMDTQPELRLDNLS